MLIYHNKTTLLQERLLEKMHSLPMALARKGSTAKTVLTDSCMSHIGKLTKSKNISITI